MSKLKTMIMALIMLTSILSGCTSSDVSSDVTDLEQKINDLQQTNDNLSTQLETAEQNLELFNNLSSELQSSLTSINMTVDELNIQITQNGIMISNITNQRDSLQLDLDEAILSNSSIISELESQLELLNQQISQLNSNSTQLEDQLEDAMEEISDLTSSLNAIADQMSRIMYQTFTDVNGCPLSDPTQKIKIGHDNNANGQLTGNEIEMIVGNCAGNSGVVASIGNTGGYPRDADISQAVEMGGNIYFIADDGIHGTELWKSDGTLGGTMMVIDLTPAMCDTCTNMDTDIRELVAGDSHLFFAANTLNNGFPDPIRELFVSDGTESGTEMVKDLFDCPTSTGDITIDYRGVNSLVAIPGSSYGTQGQDRVIFSGFSCSMESWSCNGEEPWISDGTLSGTLEVDNIRVGDTSMTTADGQGALIDIIGSQPRSFFQSGETIYFTADDNESGREIWKFDLIQTSSTGGAIVKDIKTGSSDSFDIGMAVEFTQFGEDVYFAADDGITGVELWKTDGTTSGTILVRNVDLNANSSNPKHLTVVGDDLYFTANDGVHGTELWKSNGTSVGTEIHSDISEGSNSSNPKDLIAFSNNLYFVAHNGSKNVVMATMGSTTIAFNPMGLNITNPSFGTIFSNSIYFTANEGLFQVNLISILPWANPVLFIVPVDLHAWNGAPEILVATDNEIDSENILFLTNDFNNNPDSRYLFYHWDNSYSNLHYV